MHWSGKVIPISIDFAIDSIVGDVLENKLWQRLIMARKVIGGHGGPPCETFSCARWNQIEGIVCPQPLRDAEHPWGRWNLSLKEVRRCYTGTLLMLTTLQLLFLIFFVWRFFYTGTPKGRCSGSAQVVNLAVIMGEMAFVGCPDTDSDVPTRTAGAGFC